MVQKCSHVFNLQLFAEEGEGTPEITPEQQVDNYFDKVESDFIESKKPVREQHEPVQQEEPEEREEPEPSNEPANEPEPETEKQTEPEKESTKVKFKENGQDVELTMDELIARAQKGANYERKVQELATQRKAFELAMQQKPEPAKAPIDELKQYEQEQERFANEFRGKYGIDYNPFDSIHIAKFAEHRIEQREMQKSQDYQRNQIQYAEQQLQQFYNKVSVDKDYSEINKAAQDALFLLPSKGQDGMQEFQKMYSIYQKIEQRNQYANQVNAGMRPTIQPQPFTPDDINSLSDFYNGVKNDYYTKKTVPKAAPRKQPTQTERPGTGDVNSSPRFDYSKVSAMDGDDLDVLYNNMFSQKLKDK
jgi:hypothetical protein